MTDDRGPQLRAICATFCVLATLSTLLRIYVRTRLVKAFGADDYWMMFAAIMYIWFSVDVIAGIYWGTGRHMLDLDPVDARKALRHWWFCYLSYCLTMAGAKLSIGLFLLRITVSRIHRSTVMMVMGLTVMTGLVFFFVTMLQCSPISFFWDKTSGQGSCVNIDVIIGLTYLYGTISAICDFTYGLLPIFLVRGLNMDKRDKIALVPILSMACIASSAVVVRMAYVKDFKSDDFLYKTVDIAIWSTVEQGLAITAGSLATLRPLVRLISSKISPTRHSRNTSTHFRFGSGRATPSGRKTSGFNMLSPKEKDSAQSTNGEYTLDEITPDHNKDNTGVIHKTTEVSWTIERGSRDGSEEGLSGREKKRHSLEWR